MPHKKRSGPTEPRWMDNNRYLEPSLPSTQEVIRNRMRDFAQGRGPLPDVYDLISFPFKVIVWLVRKAKHAVVGSTFGKGT